MMKLTEKGAEFIAAWEGVELDPYQDVAGYWTIGVGHLIMDSEEHLMTDHLTYEEAMELFREDVVIYEETVARYVTTSLEPHQFDALVSFTYNLGGSNFRRSTLLKRVNSRQFYDVPYQLSRWNKAGGVPVRGLSRRREAEGILFAKGVYTGPGGAL